MSFEERIKYAKILLRELKHGPLRWGDLSKVMIIHYGTPSKFMTLMKWLVGRGYIVKDGPCRSRAPYRYNPARVQFTDDDVIMKFS